MSTVETAAGSLGAGTEPRRPKLRPLMRFLPFAWRYKSLILGAAISLLVASLATLAVPLAIRRMIDFGFAAEGMINQYFAMLVVIAAVLAVASAARFYLVTTIGERVVADIRTAVFDHLATLSPAFFDQARTGELVSRLTADTTQLKSALGVSVSMALRNIIMFAGAVGMMVITSPHLSLYVVGAIPFLVLPLVAFGRNVRRRSRAAQDRLADATAYANENIQAVRTMQAFTAEASVTRRFAHAAEEAFNGARDANRARAILTAVIIFLVFASVVAVLWTGAQQVLAGTITSGRLSQFLLYAVMAASSLSQLSEVWSEVSQASGSAERLGEILAVKPNITAPERPLVLPEPARGEVSFVAVRFGYPTRPETRILDDVTFTVKAGERVAIVGPPAPASRRSSPSSSASTTRRAASSASTACRWPRSIRASCVAASPSCRRTSRSSPPPSPRTSATAAPTPPTRRSPPPPAWLMPRSSSPACPTAMPASSASAA